MNITSTKRGFTLIELLVVIAIIGILSSVVLASLNTARLKSRDARRVSDIKQLQIAIALYADSNSSNYPTNLTMLVPTYIGVQPKDPSLKASDGTPQPYQYAALGSGTTCSSYHLGAILEEAGSQALAGDVDANTAGICVGSGADFVGTDPTFDVKP